MPLPKVTALAVQNTHRLIPAKFLPNQDTVLTRIADDRAHLDDIFALDGATCDRVVGVNNLLPGIGLGELVEGVPGHSIINAAFCHAHPLGSRFNSPDRGAWYAGFELETSMAEVMFHKSLDLHEIGWEEVEESTYCDYLANFDGEFHDIRDDETFADCLSPISHTASQGLAQQLLEAGSAGVLYPSVRGEGECIACFRPAMVGNVRPGGNYIFRWTGTKHPPRMVRS